MPESTVIPTPDDWLGSAESHRFLVLDVFTERPLEGNQLGVFLDGRAFSDGQMQRLARELNFAETVFLLPPRADGDVGVRIFTPVDELPFAGHPVLGTAVVVGRALASDDLTLETGAGEVPVRLEREDGRIAFGWMSQPLPKLEPFDRVPELLRALGVPASELPVEVYRNGPAHAYVTLASPDMVARLRPDLAALADLGVATSCFARQERSWKTRMFFPGGGVPEDPATGAAAGPLALHLARQGEIAFGEEIEIHQGEEIGRPSRLYAVVRGSAERVEAIEVGGSAQIVAEGRYRIA